MALLSRRRALFATAGLLVSPIAEVARLVDDNFFPGGFGRAVSADADLVPAVAASWPEASPARTALPLRSRPARAW